MQTTKRPMSALNCGSALLATSKVASSSTPSYSRIPIRITAPACKRISTWARRHNGIRTMTKSSFARCGRLRSCSVEPEGTMSCVKTPRPGRPRRGDASSSLEAKVSSSTATEFRSSATVDGKTDDLGTILVKAGTRFSTICGATDACFESLLLAPLASEDQNEEEVLSKNNSSVVMRLTLAAAEVAGSPLLAGR